MYEIASLFSRAQSFMIRSRNFFSLISRICPTGQDFSALPKPGMAIQLSRKMTFVKVRKPTCVYMFVNGRELCGKINILVLRDDIDVVNLCFCNQKTTVFKFSPDKIIFVDYCSNRMLHYVYVYLFNSREVIFDIVYSIRNTDFS